MKRRRHRATAPVDSTGRPLSGSPPTPRRLHLVCIAPYVPYVGIDHAGGEYLLRYLTVFQDFGWEISLFAPDDETNRHVIERGEQPRGITVHTFPAREGRLRRRVRFIAAGHQSANPLRRILNTPHGRTLMGRADVVDLQWYAMYSHARWMRRRFPHAVIFGGMHDRMTQSVSRARRSGSVKARAVNTVALPAVKFRERHAVRALDGILVFKESDAAETFRDGFRGSTFIAPPVVDTDPSDLAPDPTSRTFVFSAAFWRAENDEAAQWLLDEVWPKALEQNPDLRLRIAGSRPSAELRGRADSTVEVTGYLPNIIDGYRGTLAAVVPLRRGAGLKFKTAQAIATGFPIVSTSVGLEGIDSLLGVEAPQPRDDAAAFADEICRLAHDPDAAIAEAVGAQVAIAAGLDFANHMKALNELMLSALTRRS